MDDFRLCSKCGEMKPPSEFYKEKRVCNECEKKRKHLSYENNKAKRMEQSRKYYEEHKKEILEYKKKWYKDNPDKVLTHRENQKEHCRINERKRRQKLFELYDEIKTPCAKCGEDRLYVIEFHHIDPGEKEHTVSQMRNLDKVREEAKKCVCLCANCHTEFHHFYGKYPGDPVGALKEYLGRDDLYGCI